MKFLIKSTIKPRFNTLSNQTFQNINCYHFYSHSPSNPNPTETSTTDTPITDPPNTIDIHHEQHSSMNTFRNAKLKHSKQKFEFSEDHTESLVTAFNYCINTFETEEPQINDTLLYLNCSPIERLAVIVLRTFHFELSRIRTDSTSSDAAKIRLLWWKAAIHELIDENENIQIAKQTLQKRISKELDADEKSKIYQNASIDPYSFLPSTQSTPVLQALRIVRRKYNLNSEWLLKLVTAREIFISSNTFVSMFEMEEYAENTQALLLYLSMECMSIAYNTSSANHFKCASHLSVFMTIVSVIHSVPIAAYNGFLSLPDDICMDYNLWDVEDDILKGNNCTALTNAVEYMIECAYEHLLGAKDIVGKGLLDDKVLSVMLCSLPAQRYIKKLEKFKCNVFHTRLLEPDMGIGWKMQLAWKGNKGIF